MIIETINQTEIIDSRPFLIEPLIDEVLPIVVNYAPLLIIAVLSVWGVWRLLKFLVK